jgi:N-acetylmuramoyl-L-alanine amidase
MPELWLPGAHVDRGRNAGYNAGRSQMVRAVAHYTVGSDSRNVGRDGYFHWLVHRDASRENGCTQYAEVDAITWHAADAGNPYGPGIEWERNVTGGLNAEGLSEAEPLTDNQLQWGKRLLDFLAQWNIPTQLYNGPRYGAGNWRGWVNHQAIDSSRSDGLLRAEWDLMQTGGGAPAPTPPPPITEDDETMLIVNRSNHEVAVLCGDHQPLKIRSVNDYKNGTVLSLDNDDWWRFFNNQLKIYQAVTGDLSSD